MFFLFSQWYGPLKTKCRIKLRKETWISGEYKNHTVNWDYPFKLFQFRFESRGTNTQRSTMHIWVDRNVSMWWGHEDEAPDGYDVYVFFEKDFHLKYDQPACAAKLPRELKNKKQKLSDSAKRKIQVLPWEAAPLQMEFYNYKKYDAHIRCIIRFAACPSGPLQMPILVCRKLTQLMDLSNCAHRDFAYQNAQRAISILYSIVINIKSGKLNYINGKINPNLEWKCKPAVLDAHTYRNGMRNNDNELSIMFLCFNKWY